MNRSILRSIYLALLVAAPSTLVFARQATTGLDRTVLPIPDPKFGGTAARTIDK
jgi:hypothetical protein